jgi:hypothetical protein
MSKPVSARKPVASRRFPADAEPEGVDWQPMGVTPSGITIIGGWDGAGRFWEAREQDGMVTFFYHVLDTGQRDS